MGRALVIDPTAEPARADDHAGDEDALAARARSDRAAFAALYRRYLDAVYAYCYRQLGDRHAAEDATSAVFTRALAAMPGFRSERGTFRSWLFAIAHNAVVDEHRRRRPAAPIEAAAAIPTPDAGPEAQAVLTDQVRRLRALLAGLPPKEADVVHLRLAGLDDQEIARVLGRSHGAVRVAQHRALTRLRATLAASETEDADAR